jgi:parvulin-like peptidyl-prolyl isomerase
MRRTLPLLALFALLAGCGSHRVSAPSGAVAQVGDETITAAQLGAVLTSAKAYYASQKRAFPAPGTPAYRKLRTQTIDSLVQDAVFAQVAKKLGVGVDPGQVDAEIESIAQQSYDGNENELRAALHDQGMSMALLRDQERRQLVQDAVTAKVASEATVPDAVARAYYRAHRSDYRTKPSRDVRHILVAKRALADDIYRRLQGGASFDALVQRYSTDTATKPSGGKMTDTKGIFVAPFERVAFALATDEISKPVHTQYGWHVIQALSPVTPGRIEPYGEAAPAIRAVLLQGVQSKVLKTFTKTTYTEYCNGKIAFGAGYATSFCAPYRTTTSSA